MSKLGRNYTLAHALYGAHRSLRGVMAHEGKPGHNRLTAEWFDGRLTAFLAMAKTEAEFGGLSHAEKVEAARSAVNQACLWSQPEHCK